MPISSINNKHLSFANSIHFSSTTASKEARNERGLTISPQTQIQKSLDKAKQTTNTLQSRFDEIRTQGVASRKAAARQRMLLLKQRIEKLQMLSVVHPISAQEIKRLAQELKGLVAQYAGLNEDGTKPVSSLATPNFGAHTASNGASGGASEDHASPADSTAATATTATTDTNAATAIAKTEDDSNTAQTTTRTPDTTNATADRAQATTPNGENKALFTIDRSALKRADQEHADDLKFLAEAKQLAARIKALASRIKPPRNFLEREALKQAKNEIEAMDKLFEKARDALDAEYREAIKAIAASNTQGNYDAGGGVLSSFVTPQISLEA